MRVQTINQTLASLVVLTNHFTRIPLFVFLVKVPQISSAFVSSAEASRLGTVGTKHNTAKPGIQTTYSGKGTRTSSLATIVNKSAVKMSMNDADIDDGYVSGQDENGNGESGKEMKICMNTHYVFLVHGWLGNSNEMKYIETSIQRAVQKYDANETTRVVTHSTTSNDSQTTDGIAKGGYRLAREVEEFIQRDLQKHSDVKDNEDIHVSISFVGNSLGGLYARYALSELEQILTLSTSTSDDDKDQNNNTNTNIHLHYNIFATTCTPHLGVASHTFLPLPRFAEQAVGRTLRQTGKDLFRIDKISGTSSESTTSTRTDDSSNDLIFEMSTNYPKFLQPLKMFRRRIAYVNAFRTDFQVPTSTAAFLNRNSTYPHYVNKYENKSSPSSSPPFIVAVVETKQNDELLREGAGISKSLKHTMSVKLDALGWEKVFVDVREYIPLPSMGMPFTKKLKKTTARQKWEEFVKDREAEINSDASSGIEVDSSTLEKYMTDSDNFNVPVGHQVMVANSKSKSYANFTKKGKPVMDHLADDMVDYLLGSGNDGSASKSM